MEAIDNKLLEKYYQRSYDFNTESLDKSEVTRIKRLAKEKRVNYNLAPLGGEIFRLIEEREPDIRFELVDFDSDEIDGMLYIPKVGSNRGYIILNSNRPFVSQVFAAAHEYYHYLEDYGAKRNTPFICNLQELDNIKEKRASRFAAEILLPEEALRAEILSFRQKLQIAAERELRLDDYAILSIYLTIKYQMPLKAVIYRFCEEGFIREADKFIEQYGVLKAFLFELTVREKEFETIYANENPYVDVNDIYSQMRDAYVTGFASRDEILKDSEVLGLDLTLIEAFLEPYVEDMDDEKDDELDEMIRGVWGR